MWLIVFYGYQGTIPVELFDAPLLTELSLFENALTGDVPASLGRAAPIQSLNV